jgi:hypothetical protein
MVVVAKGEGDLWELRIHGRRLVKAEDSVGNVYVVAHTGSEQTMNDYAQIVRDLLAEGLREELRKTLNQLEAKAA